MAPSGCARACVFTPVQFVTIALIRPCTHPTTCTHAHHDAHCVQILPGNSTNQIVQKDWFPIHDLDGAPVGMGEGAAALQILLSIDPAFSNPISVLANSN